MANNELPSARFKVCGVIDPDANAAGALTSDYCDLGEFGSAMAVILAGAFGSSGTLAAKLVQATDSSGTGVKDITGKAITTLTDAGSDSDKQAIINVFPDDLDLDNGFNHVAIVLTTAVATGDSAAVLFGCDPRYSEGADLASVDEIVT